jgi:urease accessory protein
MLRATAAGHFHKPVADTVVLDYEERRRRRAVVKAISGKEFLVDLPEPPVLGPGDGYVLEDGSFVEIVAAPEALMEVRGKTPLHAAQLAYHIGNRHLECQISEKHIRLRRDHVIAEMLKGLGAKVAEVEAPFFPEGGAYAHHAHDHGHHRAEAHSHAHSYGHSHAHESAHSHSHAHAHAHGAHAGDHGCGHDHGRGHKHGHGHDRGHGR